MQPDPKPIFSAGAGFDKSHVRRAFEQASGHYERFTALQRNIGEELLERLRLFRLQPQRVLDVGAGTGWLTGKLMAQYPRAQVHALDLSHGMLVQAAQHNGWRRKMGRVCGDAESLPFASASVDLLFSNLAMQWCPDLPTVFEEFRRVVKPGGLILFSSFGPMTLKELRQAWAQVDEHVHVNDFVDLHEVGDAMLRAGLTDPVVDVDRMCLHYPDVQTLMRDLKGMGAHNINHGRAHGLTAPGTMKRMIQAYETLRDGAGLPASFEVVYGHAQAPMRVRGQEVPLSSLLGGG